jgi:methionyl-tRNA formyltransferase
MPALRLVFMGTAELACATLQALIDTPGFELAAVVTQPDRPKGRQLKMQPSPVKELALNRNLPLLQPERARNQEFLDQLAQIRPDLIVVVAYGQILSQQLLDLPRFGCLNVHTSLLPKYRGAAPIQWAIVNGEAETGVTIMKMDAGLDTGPILSQASTRIESQDTAETLHRRLAVMGAELVCAAIPGYVAGTLQPQAQPAEGSSYAPKIKKEDGQIDWRRPSISVWNRVRGLVPWPGGYAFLPASPGRRLLKIWIAEPAPGAGAPGEVLQADRTGIRVACGSGALRILELQPESGRRLSAQEFLSGHPLVPGQHLA